MALDFWGYVLLAFVALTILETLTCCFLKRRELCSAMCGSAANAQDAADDVSERRTGHANFDGALSKGVAGDFAPYSPARWRAGGEVDALPS